MDSIEVISELFEKFASLYEHGDFEDLKTQDGKTQGVERSYTGVFEDVVKDAGHVYDKASSQEPYDFRIFLDETLDHKEVKRQIRKKEDLPCLESQLLLVEMKKTDSGTIILNDTVPKSDAFYIVVTNKTRVKTSGKSISLYLGSQLCEAWNEEAKANDAWIKDIHEYNDYILDLRKVMNGAACPRANITIKDSYLNDPLLSFEIA
jgi:hypothetical protein